MATAVATTNKKEKKAAPAKAVVKASKRAVADEDGPVFEAKLDKAGTLKKIIEAIKEVVTDTNFDCSPSGIGMQAMDSSHVSLVSLLLKSDGFVQYQCDRTLSLGLNLASMTKILKCSQNEDTVHLSSNPGQDTIKFVFESTKSDKVAEFELKLMTIDGESLGIPDAEYKSEIKMPAGEFQRICRDLTVLGDTVAISTNSEGVKFSVAGEMGSGNILLKGSASVDSEESVSVKIDEEVNLTFALRYLNLFSKGSSLSNMVTLSLSPEVPLKVEYNLQELGYLRFYLAPKIDEDTS